MSEGQHQSNYKHPKIAKSTANKLPTAFLQSKNTVIVPKKSQKQKIRQQKGQTVSKQLIADPQSKPQVVKKRSTKQSRNPFLPMKKLSMLAEKFIEQTKLMGEQLNQHKFGYNLNHQSKPQNRDKIKYEDFITLTHVSKKQTTSLKKILHISTLTVYYLRECLISISIDKSELMEWIQNCNKGAKKGKIVEMFWNMPEGYYSLVYDYEQGILMQNLLDSLNTLPLSVIRDIAIFHFTSNIGIYNSQLIVNVGKDGIQPSIYFLPIFEETPPLIKSEKIQEAIIQQIDEENQQQSLNRKIIWRLGIILLASFIGEQFLRSDLLRVKVPLQSCCLLHAIIALPSSLTNLYMEENNLFEEAQHLISFLCHLLSSKQSPNFTKSLKQLRKHKFLTTEYESLNTLKQLIQTIFMIDLEGDQSYALGQFGSDLKLHNTMDFLRLSLQNIDEKLVMNFSLDNPNIRYIANELGLKNQVEKVANCLKQAYERQNKLLNK